MQFYWQCEDCDETNLYPDVKVCEACGKPMSSAAERRVLQQIEEEERARQEAERRKQAAIKAAQEAEIQRKRLAALAEKMHRKAAREAKIGSASRKLSRFSVGLIRVCAAVAVTFSVILFVKNSDQVNFEPVLERLSNNIHSEYLAHTIVVADDGLGDTNDAGGRSSRILYKIGTQLYVSTDRFFSRVDSQLQYLEATYTPVDNVAALFEYIVGFLSEGVE